MKRAKMITKIFSMALLLSLNFSCAKTKSSDTDPNLFYGIVYEAVYARAPGTNNWIPVQGLYEIKFSQDSDSGNGSFVMHYTSYLEPQFCPFNLNCVCNGGTSGTFTQYSSSTPTTTSSSTPYDPNQTYVDPNSSATATIDPSTLTDPRTGAQIYSKIYPYNFNIQILSKSLSSGCKAESNRLLKMARFENGDLIMNNDYRDLYFVPEVLKK